MSGDGGIGGWHVVAFLLGVLVALVIAAGLYMRTAKKTARPAPRRSHVLEEMERGPTPVDDGPRQAWPDVEKGGGGNGNNTARGDDDKRAHLTPRQLRETLRQLLESELPKGLRESGLVAQLDRLEERILSGCSWGCEPKLESKAGAVGPRAAARGGDGPAAPALHVKLAGGAQEAAAPAAALPQKDAAAHPVELAAADTAASSPSPKTGEVPDRGFGPTDRQLGLPDPPEKCSSAAAAAGGGADGESSAQASLSTVQKILGRRDAQTTELHRQLKEARQCLWEQTVEAKAAAAKLQEVLTDPSRAQEAQAEMIQQLRKEVKELAARLADARAQEKQWSAIARRQRAYFLQTEHLGQDGLAQLRRHPCGEIFLVPPPIAALYEEEDAAALQDGSGWDVGKSHCDPYKVDSWPFEPNVLAARASKEPNLQHWAEGEDEEDQQGEDDDEAGQLYDRSGDDYSPGGGEAEDESGDGSPSCRPPASPPPVLPPVPGGAERQPEGAESARSL